MDQIVLFWSGKDLSIPKYFINSILVRNLKKIKIIQVSDKKTKKIEGVDLFITDDLPKDLMTARLKAYSKVETENANTIFCDADSLLLNDFTLSNFKSGYYLIKRKGNFVINAVSQDLSSLRWLKYPHSICERQIGPRCKSRIK